MQGHCDLCIVPIWTFLPCFATDQTRQARPAGLINVYFSDGSCSVSVHKPLKASTFNKLFYVFSGDDRATNNCLFLGLSTSQNRVHGLHTDFSKFIQRLANFCLKLPLTDIGHRGGGAIKAAHNNIIGQSRNFQRRHGRQSTAIPRRKHADDTAAVLSNMWILEGTLLLNK